MHFRCSGVCRCRGRHSSCGSSPQAASAESENSVPQILYRIFLFITIAFYSQMPVSPSCSRSIGAVFYFDPDGGISGGDPERDVEPFVAFRPARQMQSRRLQGGPRDGNDRNVETYLSAVGGRNDERPFEPDESAVGQLTHNPSPRVSPPRWPSRCFRPGYPQSRGSGRKFDAVDLAEYRLRFRIGTSTYCVPSWYPRLTETSIRQTARRSVAATVRVRTADRMDRVGVRSRVLQEQLVGRTAGAGRLRISRRAKCTSSHAVCRERFGCEDEPVGPPACEEEFVLPVRHAHRHPAVGGPSFAEECVEEEPVALPAEGIDRNVRGSLRAAA